MTAAERQRRCRANGKGRHRGGIRLSKADKERMRAEHAAVIAALEAEENAEAAAAAGALPFLQPQTSPPVAKPVVAETPAPPLVDWNLSAMAA